MRMAEKVKRYDRIVSAMIKLNDNNILDTIDSIQSIIRGNSADEIEFSKHEDRGFTYPFERNADIRKFAASFCGGYNGTLTYCFIGIFRRCIEIGFYKKGDMLPSPSDVAEYLSTSTKQYPKKILDAFKFLSEEHRRITDGAVFSPKVIHRIGYDVFTVI